MYTWVAFFTKQQTTAFIEGVLVRCQEWEHTWDLIKCKGKYQNLVHLVESDRQKLSDKVPGCVQEWYKGSD